MKIIYEDLENMVKPSWVTSVPDSLSSVGPKLKSDQWRTLGSVYLPVSLIRLWSIADPDSEREKHRRELLHLTILLFSAISVATSRITSGNNAEEYLRLMTEYRQELRRLFPDYPTRPNHHMAFHIAEFLRRYGPVHGWWTFPFERMIGMIQRIPTNHKPGLSLWLQKLLLPLKQIQENTKLLWPTPGIGPQI
jgi:hypothetical protein